MPIAFAVVSYISSCAILKFGTFITIGTENNIIGQRYHNAQLERKQQSQWNLSFPEGKSSTEQFGTEEPFWTTESNMSVSSRNC